MTACIVCQKNDGIYKCPKCRQKYCSVGCCKKHKQIDCNESKVMVEPKVEPKYITEDTLKEDCLIQLPESKELVEMLKNSELQNVLTGINNSLDPDKDLQSAMQQDSHFLKFVDKCLSIVEPNQQNTQIHTEQKLANFISDQFKQ